MNLRTPGQRDSSSNESLHIRKQLVSKIGLTPVMEEMSHLRLTSTVKKSKDDFDLSPHLNSILNMEIPEWNEEDSSPNHVSFPAHMPINDSPPTKLQTIKQAYEDALGPRGMVAQQLSKRKKVVKIQ